MGVLIMTHLYSASTGGFYLKGVHTGIPADAVTISDDDFTALMDAQAAGNEIKPGADGSPVARLPVITADDLLSNLRTRRDRLLADSDFTQLPDSPLTEAQRIAWAGYRTALRNLPETYAADPAAVIWPAQPA